MATVTFDQATRIYTGTDAYAERYLVRDTATETLARGGIATATIFISIFAWNELLLPLFLTNRVAKTFPVLLTAFQGQTEIAWELMCAGATIQVLPILILTFFVQKYIIAGLTLGSVK